MTKELMIPDSTAKEFDKVVEQCSAVLSKEGMRSIKDSFLVVQGIKFLKEFFSQPEFKELIEFAQDNVAGFLTDRSEEAIYKHNKNPNKRYELKPYTHGQILNAIIPLMLEGYALHGNEINVISRQGYRTKQGKHARILEMTDGFQENIATPAIKDGYAYFKATAKWQIDGSEQRIGHDENDECLLKIPYSEKKFDTIDKVYGKAQSKLYTRVLTRITGRFIPDEPDIKDITDKAEEIKPNGAPPPPPKAKPTKPEPPANEPEKPDSSETSKPGNSQEKAVSSPPEKPGPKVQALIDARADKEKWAKIKGAVEAKIFGLDEVDHAINYNSEKEAAGILEVIEE